MAVKDERFEKAKQVALRKMGFIRHAIAYIFVMVVLLIINNATSSVYQWWLWPALGWGIGVVAHFLSTFVFREGTLEKRLIQREIERIEDEE